MHLLRTGLTATVFVSIFILFLPLSAQSAEVTIVWDPNAEQDLQGCGIYLRERNNGPSYTLYGDVAIEELETSICFIQTLGGKNRLIGWVRVLSAVCLGALIRAASRLRPAGSASVKHQGLLNPDGRVPSP